MRKVAGLGTIGLSFASKILLFVVIVVCLLFSPVAILGSYGSSAVVNSTSVNPNILQRTLTSPFAQTGGWFGHYLASGGRMVVIGAPYESDFYYESGSAYVFNATTGSLIGALFSPNRQIDGWFGASVAITSKYLVVGAYGENVSGYYEGGRAYVFNATNDALVNTFTSPNAQLEGKFGSNVAISGNILIVSAANETADGIVGAGHAYTFNATTGALIATLTSPNAQTGGLFGSGSDISGRTAVVSADQESAFGFQHAGRAYVFNALSGALISTLTSPNAQVDGYFGNAISISGHVVAVGAYGESASGHSGAGHAYTFNANTGALYRTFSGPGIQTDGYFGSDVSISNNVILVGAWGKTVYGYVDAGHAYTFNATTGVRINTFTSPKAQVNGYFGDAVAISGNVIVIGAPGENASGYYQAGNAYLF